MARALPAPRPLAQSLTTPQRPEEPLSQPLSKTLTQQGAQQFASTQQSFSSTFLAPEQEKQQAPPKTREALAFKVNI